VIRGVWLSGVYSEAGDARRLRRPIDASTSEFVLIPFNDCTGSDDVCAASTGVTTAVFVIRKERIVLCHASEVQSRGDARMVPHFSVAGS
jgi:hypothetical protein